MSEELTTVETISEAWRVGVEPHRTEDAKTHFPLPPGWTVSTVDPQKSEDHPRRSKGETDLFDLDSFVRRVEALGGGATVVYADPDERTLVAVLNDDVSGEAGWRDHRVAYALRPTSSWKFWTERQGVGEQQRFAETIQDGIDDITQPSGAEMLEVAQTFHASIGSKFQQGARLRDGAVQFMFVEDVDAKAGINGDVAIPEEFTITVAPFHGTEPRDVKARLRYRVRGGELAIGYELPLQDRIADDAFTEVVTAAIGLLGGWVFLGRAPSPTS